MMKIPGVVLVILLASVGACKSDRQPAPVGKRYRVRVAAGTPTQVLVTPTGGWKINLEYQNRLEATARPSGKAIKLGHSAAKVTARQLSFSVPVQPAQTYEGRVAFAICNPQHCIPVREPIRWKVAKR